MRVAFLVINWKGAEGTGVTRYIMHLVNEMRADSDVEPHVLFRNGCDPHENKIKGFKYTFPLKAFLVLKRVNPDVVHVDANWYFLMAGLLTKKLKGARLVATLHSHPNKLPPLGRFVMQHLLDSCDAITYVSENLKELIHKNWVVPQGVKEFITYPGVTTQQVTDEELNEFIAKFGIPINAIILLMQSSPIAKVKADGTKVLMVALQELLPHYPNLILLVTGSGQYLEELKEAASELGVKDHVIFTGWLDNPFVPLTLCDIYTHISLGEGMPLSLLESMSLGKPIIATSVGGIPEVIVDGNNGLLVEAHPKSIARTIELFLTDKDLMGRMGQNAYMDAKKYTWRRSEGVFKGIFKEIMT